MDEKRGKKLRVPWITDEGFLDLAAFPIEILLRQAVDGDPRELRSACTLLSTMHHSGRTEAGIFLLGLLKHFGDDLARKAVVVDALKEVGTRPAAELLFSELEQTESSNSTRTYINTILKALRWFPAEMVREGFEELLNQPRWSHRMKRGFREVLEVLEELD